jgi:hypothetical protein
LLCCDVVVRFTEPENFVQLASSNSDFFLLSSRRSQNLHLLGRIHPKFSPGRHCAPISFILESFWVAFSPDLRAAIDAISIRPANRT